MTSCHASMRNEQDIKARRKRPDTAVHPMEKRWKQLTMIKMDLVTSRFAVSSTALGLANGALARELE